MMQSSLIHMGQRLKQILKQKKIKIVDFAKMAGFTNQIAHYHLRKGDMKRATMDRFCTLIGITVDEFVRWNGAMQLTNGKNIHHGSRLQNVIAEKGLNKSKLAGRLNMSRRTMYNLFEKENFSPDELDRVVKGLDMSAEAFLNPGALQESRSTDSEEMMILREKYYKLLEEHNLLLKSHAALKDDVIHVKKELAACRKQSPEKND
ncbi:Cro/C1-type helix-turn-helix DNA-binding protein [Chitinophaga niastensis]|uniref:Cro/C1-type helix-turn-helix DNA-binding protein n=1 Tax=Chitinophaga niastensis TaxID=536980 RepID=A0A2P8HSC8_CHINA|nr:helix-turn-helix transcriptional regulator [Chitinophaga niastensis]PSL49108.1 Cro/C1-type helix-turn-helix DNA-binding protein [Chitinophaga niastensis]